MRNLMLIFILSPSVLGAHCDDWAEKVTRQWRSVLLSEHDIPLDNNIPYISVDPEQHAWETNTFVPYSDQAAVSETASIPLKFQRASSESSATRDDNFERLLRELHIHTEYIKTHQPEIQVLLDGLDDDFQQEWKKLFGIQETESPKKVPRKLAISIDLQ